MNNKSTLFPKLALDQFLSQLIWTFWALGIFLVINIGKMIFSDHVDSFYSASYIAGNIYMLVIGIIIIYAMPYYVENGITRKDYFYGNVIAGLGLSITLPILTYLISLIEKFIINVVTQVVLTDRTLTDVEVDVDGNIIGEIIQAFILTPFISPESNILLSLGLFSLNLFVFYLVGWLIGSAFYRLGVISGILFIGVAIVVIAIKDSMIRLVLDLPLFETFSVLGIVPEGFALPLVAASILLTIVLIRLLTKRAPIKI